MVSKKHIQMRLPWCYNLDFKKKKGGGGQYKRLTKEKKKKTVSLILGAELRIHSKVQCTEPSVFTAVLSLYCW